MRKVAVDPDLKPWVYGSPDWQEQRETARKEAWGISNSQDRAAALRHVEDYYGPGPSGTTILRDVAGDDGKRRGDR